MNSHKNYWIKCHLTKNLLQFYGHMTVNHRKINYHKWTSSYFCITHTLTWHETPRTKMPRLPSEFRFSFLQASHPSFDSTTVQYSTRVPYTAFLLFIPLYSTPSRPRPFFPFTYFQNSLNAYPQLFSHVLSSLSHCGSCYAR